MSGLEFLSELRKRRDLPQPIIFVLTTSGRAKERSAAHAFHVAGYIQKRSAGPGFRDLADMIARYLEIVDLPEFATPAD
jgi:DNA-binding NarL/FixJ family response regulator